LESGIEQQYLDQVDCPIGLNVGAETPAEIAVAVVGQLLARIKSQDPDEQTWRELDTSI
jgi:xanthine dehydrogenase accessory factor